MRRHPSNLPRLRLSVFWFKFFGFSVFGFYLIMLCKKRCPSGASSASETRCVRAAGPAISIARMGMVHVCQGYLVRLYSG